MLLKQEKLPLPEKEFRFCERRWRFDYAWPDKKIACEQEGGIFSGGRHTRGKGFLGDMEKYNEAVLLGWKVLRFTPQQMENEAVIALKKLLENLNATS